MQTASNFSSQDYHFYQASEYLTVPRSSSCVSARTVIMAIAGWEMLELNRGLMYPLVMTNIAMVKPWPIEIDGLPGFTY